IGVKVFRWWRLDDAVIRNNVVRTAANRVRAVAQRCVRKRFCFRLRCRFSDAQRNQPSRLVIGRLERVAGAVFRCAVKDVSQRDQLPQLCVSSLRTPLPGTRCPPSGTSESPCQPPSSTTSEAHSPCRPRRKCQQSPSHPRPPASTLLQSAPKACLPTCLRAP